MDTYGRQPHTRANLWLDAADKKAGLTLGELRTILQEAMRADMGDGARVRVSIGWSRQIQRIEIEG